MKCFESRVYEKKDDKYIRTPSVFIAHAESIEVVRDQLKFFAMFFSGTYLNGFVFVTKEIAK